jgi:GGDEF domain-containing protein
MISLKPYLFRGDGNREVEEAYQRMIGLFLQAISLHSVEGDKTDHERFCADIKSFAARFTPELSMSEQFILVGEVLRTLEDYNRHTTKFLRIQNTELQKMIGMLTETVIAVGSGTENSVTSLQEIEKSIEQVRLLEDIHSIKAQLGICLEGVRGETQRQKDQGKVLLEKLEKELAQTRRSGSTVVNLDQVTHLPDKTAAEARLREAVGAVDLSFLVLAVVNRVHAVNARFGYAIGDEVLAEAAQHFRESLSNEDQLFRWQGPALVAILKREESIDAVREELRRFADKKIDKTFMFGARSILLPISTSWTVFLIESPLDALIRKVETFTAAQLSSDYV